MYTRYLHLLGLGAVQPNLEGLRQVVRSHLVGIPFENISKCLYGRQGATDIPALPQYLDDVEQRRFGGTCYANNFHLCSLLCHLGFEARLCGGDMAHGQDLHLALMVRCADREYLVDGGFGAPFLEPVPADTVRTVTLGDERWTVSPESRPGRVRVDYYQGETLRHGYSLNPASRALEEFRQIIAASYAPDAFFMKTVRIVRFTDRGVVSLSGHRLSRHIDGRTSMVMVTDTDLPTTIEEVFGMPAQLVARAIG